MPPVHGAPPKRPPTLPATLIYCQKREFPLLHPKPRGFFIFLVGGDPRDSQSQPGVGRWGEVGHAPPGKNTPDPQVGLQSPPTLDWSVGRPSPTWGSREGEGGGAGDVANPDRTLDSPEQGGWCRRGAGDPHLGCPWGVGGGAGPTFDLLPGFPNPPQSSNNSQNPPCTQKSSPNSP